MRTEFPRKGECMAEIGSVTQAMQAQRALANAAIYARVEKIDSQNRRRGCVYGVVYDCRQEEAAALALRAVGIRTRRKGGLG